MSNPTPFSPDADTLDPSAIAPLIARLIFEIAHDLRYRIELSPPGIQEAMTMAAAELSRERDAQIQRHQQALAASTQVEEDDEDFPGAVAWTKQVAAIIHYLMRTRPILTAQTAGDISHSPGEKKAMIAASEPDPTGNERIILVLAFHLLAIGVKFKQIWRMRPGNKAGVTKACLPYCDAERCFIDRYFCIFYSTQNGAPSNLDYMIGFLRWEGLSLKTTAILLDHILYGACILAPDLAAPEQDPHETGGIGGPNHSAAASNP